MNSYRILIPLIFLGHFHYIISSDSNWLLIIKVVWCFLDHCPNKWRFIIFNHAKNISFFFDRVGYSSLQNSAIILREHIKKKKGELIENTGKIVHVRVESMAAISWQCLCCKLLCVGNSKPDLSIQCSFGYFCKYSKLWNFFSILLSFYEYILLNLIYVLFHPLQLC